MEDLVPIDSCAPPELPPISAEIRSLTFADRDLYVAHTCSWGDWTINPVDYESCHAADQIAGGPEEDADGLAWDGTHFWLIVDYRFIFEIDPSNGERVGWFLPPDNSPGGLDWDGTCFWLIYRHLGIIQQVAVSSGGVVKRADPSQLPDKAEITAIYPNPFNEKVRIQYRLNSISGGRLVIYNLMGREIRNFKLATTLGQCNPGVVIWDGCDQSGKRVGSVIYFFALKTHQTMAIKKVFFLK